MLPMCSEGEIIDDEGFVLLYEAYRLQTIPFCSPFSLIFNGKITAEIYYFLV